MENNTITKDIRPPFFFHTCPFCKVVNINIFSYKEEGSNSNNSRGIISCTCGITIEVKVNSWEDLRNAARQWNKEVDEMSKETQKE